MQTIPGDAVKAYVEADELDRSLTTWIEQSLAQRKKRTLSARSLVLYGPTGAGKRTRVQLAAQRLHLRVHPVHCAALVSADSPRQAVSKLCHLLRDEANDILLLADIDGLIENAVPSGASDTSSPDRALLGDKSGRSVSRSERGTVADATLASSEFHLKSWLWTVLCTEMRWLGTDDGASRGPGALIMTCWTHLPCWGCVQQPVPLPTWQQRKQYLQLAGGPEPLADITPGYTYAELHALLWTLRMRHGSGVSGAADTHTTPVDAPALHRGIPRDASVQASGHCSKKTLDKTLNIEKQMNPDENDSGEETMAIAPALSLPEECHVERDASHAMPLVLLASRQARPRKQTGSDAATADEAAASRASTDPDDSREARVHAGCCCQHSNGVEAALARQQSAVGEDLLDLSEVPPPAIVRQVGAIRWWRRPAARTRTLPLFGRAVREAQRTVRQALAEHLAEDTGTEQRHLRSERNVLGILLYGATGNGKTHFAEMLAHPWLDSEAHFAWPALNMLPVQATDIVSARVGEAERALQSVLTVCESMGNCVLFIDHIEMLAAARDGPSSTHGVHERLLSILLQYLDGFYARRGCRRFGFVVATDEPKRLDRALLRPGRLDLHIELPTPDALTRMEAFKYHLSRAMDQDALPADIGEHASAFATATSGLDMAGVRQAASDWVWDLCHATTHYVSA